jgi:peptide-methionine (R)-S-oxide reductase
MNKRYFLQFGAAMLGTAFLTRQINGRSKTMAISNNAPEFNKTDEEWRKTLTPEQYNVLRKHGTEPAFTSPLDKNYEHGTYDCAACGQPLFSSETKYHSGTGWPSFYQPIPGAIATTVDNSFMMTRTEVHCSRCGGHLGHVFDDGPAPTGKRYCMNGIAMKFIPA